VYFLKLENIIINSSQLGKTLRKQVVQLKIKERLTIQIKKLLNLKIKLKLKPEMIR